MTILKKIIEHKKEEVVQQKKLQSIVQFQAMVEEIGPARNFCEVLENYRQKGEIAVIAEVKKASPSKGVIRQDFNHIEIARAYEKAGAAAISVLTDHGFFQGSIEYLKDIRKTSGLPLLRKDFIIDEFQIYQTRSIGADIILLIASVLGKDQLKDYLCLSQELGLNVLLEVHNRQEFDFALETGVKIVGINNRDLKTFKVDLQNTVRIIKDRALENTFIISESGIETSPDIRYLKKNGVNGVLIGEAFMKQENIETAYNNLIK